MGTPPALQLSGLVKEFGNTTAVAGVDLAAGPGEVLGLLGPNGAGKTTTLRMICGLLAPTRGRVLVEGLDLWHEPTRVRSRLGYLDEEPIVYPHLTGREFLGLVADLYGVERGPQRDAQIGRLLEVLEFRDKADDMISAMSHGTRQKVGLASILIHDPSVMLLDEPTNGLDPRAARRVKDILQELAARGRTVILSTHILEVAQALCNRVAIMDRGRLVAIGTMEELRSGSGAAGASLEELFLELTGGPESHGLIEQLLRS